MQDPRGSCIFMLEQQECFIKKAASGETAFIV